VVFVARLGDGSGDLPAPPARRAYEIVNHAAGSPDIVPALTASQADVAVLDASRVAALGLTALRHVRERLPTLPVVLIAGEAADEFVAEAIRHDVNGLVADGTAPQLIWDCITGVLEGQIWLDPLAVRRAVKALAARHAAAREAARILTPRELEIVRLVGGGQANKEIGSTLFVTEGTVKVHLHRVFKKLRIRNRRALALFARERGFV
jgi:two-component system nitrate/nitrite response regulator NarP